MRPSAHHPTAPVRALALSIPRVACGGPLLPGFLAWRSRPGHGAALGLWGALALVAGQLHAQTIARAGALPTLDPAAWTVALALAWSVVAVGVHRLAARRA